MHLTQVKAALLAVILDCWFIGSTLSNLHVIVNTSYTIHWAQGKQSTLLQLLDI